MPKNKSTGKKRGGSGTQSHSPVATRSQRGLQEIPVGHLDGIAQAGKWNQIVDFICDSLKIPDLTSRKGLKQIHKDFDDINAQLNLLYSAPNTNDQVRGGVVAIWGKMSADAILRDRLFNDNLPDKLFALLKRPDTRQLALQVISTVTHHGGVGPRKAIALRTSDLLHVMKENSDDSKIIELATVAMSHAISAVIFPGPDRPPTTNEMKKVDLVDVLRTTTENLKKGNTSVYMTDHALGLIMSATRFGWQQCGDVPSVATFLIACLRAPDITTRSQALAALVRLHEEQGEHEVRQYDPRKMMAAARKRWPDKLMNLMTSYGAHRCDTTVTLRATAEYQNAMMQVVSDHDFRGLGRRIAQLVLRTEFAIAEGGFQAENEITGQLEFIDTGLPFKMWTDSLPYCVDALRQSGSDADLDMADTLEIKFNIIRGRLPVAATVAERAIERNSNLAYAYYAIALGDDDAKGLRAVKKGLRCTGATPFVRNYMLWRAVDHAGTLGISVLLNTSNGAKEHSEGVAFLMSALEDARMFITVAPPDNRHMQTILNWYIVLTTVIEGAKLSTNMKELKDMLEKAQTADEFSRFLLAPPRKTDLRLTRDLIVAKYAAAANEWRDVIPRFNLDPSADTSSANEAFDHSTAEDELEEWLENIQEDDDGYVPAPTCGGRRASPTNVELYRCSWCGNPSAILRKCGSCSQTRYCDAACQKSHWKQHKTACKAAAGTS